VVLLLLSPSEFFEQDEVVLYKLLFPLLIWGRALVPFDVRHARTILLDDAAV